MQHSRIVVTGIGLTAPNGNDLAEFRANLLAGVARIAKLEMRYMGEVPAGVCNFDARRYQNRKEIRNGTRAGSIAVYCAHEAIEDSGIEWATVAKDRVGIYIGTTEHGNVETENEIYNISKFDYDTRFWSHHHNPRTVANNPAGEISINLGITGPHYTVGAACAAGNAGVIQGCQMLQLGEVDFAVVGGVSESIHAFGIFAGFKSQGALASHDDPNQACRPFDKARNGIVVSEGGCLFTLERLPEARERGAEIIAEVTGYHINSDALDPVLPDAERQKQCMQGALKRAHLRPEEIDIVSSHATATPQGDVQECRALNDIFGHSTTTRINNTKSFIGHAMGAAGALELAGNIPSFEDGLIHPTINISEIDEDCNLAHLIVNEPVEGESINTILNNSFGMLGINSCVIIKRFTD